MNSSNKNYYITYNKLLLIIILFFPIFLYLIPLDWINKQHTICLIKNVFGIDCFGCGITRAVLSGIHFNFEKAINYNKMVVFVLPLLIYVWIKTSMSFYKKLLTTR
jgi:hypothetical protein